MLAISGPTDSMLERTVPDSLGGGESSNIGPRQRVQIGADLLDEARIA